MATDLETLRIRLEADINDLKTGLAQAQSSIKGVDDSIKTADTGMKKFTGSLKTMAGTLGVAFAGTQLVSFAKDAVMAASNMAESVSKVNVVFGAGAEEVYKFGESAATNLGISNQAALEAAGTYGNLFQAFGLGQGQAQEMSTSLVQLAADMASFNNTSIDDAILALRSGLSGETEPLKRFGVALSEVRLKTEAMSMGLIKSTSDALTPAAKAQASYALIMKDTALAQGDYARTADGTANTMKSLKAKFDDAKVALGEALMPAFRAVLKILELLVPVLQTIGKFFKENADALKMLAIIAGTATVAYYGVRAAIIVTTTATKVFTAVMAAQRAGFTLTQIAAFNLKVAIQVLNTAMRANPIGLIVTALALLAAGFVMAWKKSETFRGIVIKGVQMILNWWAFLIEGVGKFLKLLSKVPGMGWAKGIADGAQKAADAIRNTSKNLSDLKSNFKGMGNVSMTTGTAGVKEGGKTKTTTTVDPNAAKEAEKARKEAEAKEKKRLKDVERYTKQANDIVARINKAKAEQDQKLAEAAVRRDERIADAHKANLERVERANKTYQERMEKAQNQYDERVADARDRAAKAEIAARMNYAKQVVAIEKQYADRTAALQQQLQNKISDLQESAAKKRADLTEQAAEKEQNILRQSIDRLRDAFKSGLSFSLKDSFKSGGVAGILEDFKNKLGAAKELQENAAALAGMGYSQTFIEEVVKNGPEAGNEIAKALRKASPEATKELQALYGEVEDVSNNGMDALAKTMNAGGKLATEELRKAYAQVAIDLQQSLAQVDKELQKGLAEANSEYNRNMAEAMKARTDALAEAMSALEAALAQAQDALQESLAEANADLNEAQKEAGKDLAEALEEAAKDLADTLIEVQKDYNDAVNEIVENTKAKIVELKQKLAEVTALLVQLGAANAAASAEAAALAAQQAANAAAAAALAKSSTSPAPSTVTNNTTSSNPTIEVTNNNYGSFDANAFGTALVGIIHFGTTLGIK